MIDGDCESDAFDYTKFISSCLEIYRSLVSGPKGAGGLLLNMKNGFKTVFLNRETIEWAYQKQIYLNKMKIILYII